MSSPRLPEGWCWVSIGETGEYINGYAFKPSHRESSGKPIVRIQNLTDDSKPLNRTTLDLPIDYQVGPGDMLVSWSATLDVFIWRREPALVNQHIFKVVPESKILDKRLLFYWLKQAIQELLDTEHLHGSTMKHINRGPFMAHRLPLPPLKEQNRIVERLDELLSDLDSGVAELNAAQKKLARYRQSLLKAAVEGELTAEWRAERARRGEATESGAQLLARILAERRARWEAKQLAKFMQQRRAPPKDWKDKYSEPMRPDTNDLPTLPARWVWATIDQLAEVGTGVTPLRSKAAYFLDGTIPWVTSGALNDETVSAANELVTELALNECRLEIYPVGSLLVAMYGEGKTRGKCSELLIPATINQAIAALVFSESSKDCKEYVKSYLLNSYEKMRQQASGGVQPNLNLQIIKSLALPLPPVDEQAEMVRQLASQFEQIAQQAAAVEIGLKQTSAQRKNILKAAFSGQLVPQDPNDEPASVLLERIRVERAKRSAPSRLDRQPAKGARAARK